MFQQRPGFADDAMQTNVHKTLHPFHSTKNIPTGTATVTKTEPLPETVAEGSQRTGNNAMCIKFRD